MQSHQHFECRQHSKRPGNQRETSGRVRQLLAPICRRFSDASDVSRSGSATMSFAHTHTHTQTLALSLSHRHSLTLTPTPTHTYSLSLSLSTHIHTHTHTHTHEKERGVLEPRGGCGSCWRRSGGASATRVTSAGLAATPCRSRSTRGA